jgi:hypothetical protein
VIVQVLVIEDDAELAEVIAVFLRRRQRKLGDPPVVQTVGNGYRI